MNRLWRNASACGFALLLVLAARAQAQPALDVLHVGVTVSDLDRAVAFYTGVLDFEKISDTEIVGQPYEQLTGVFGLRARVARLRLGEEVIELTEYLTPGGRPIPIDSRSNDRWFQHIAIITSDMDTAYARLREHRVKHASTGPQRLPDWNPNAGGIEAFYFLDPDRHVLEVLAFPPGKGDPRWHRKDGLFLGIDHTAIVVADTDRSLAFYRDTLGFTVVGGSENHGDEQARLNNVQGARLRITTLRPSNGGVAVELLEYLQPGTGRPYPSDARADDLWHWQTILRVQKFNADWRPTKLPDAALGYRAGVIVRDPDGHAVGLVE
jgi:catechol 2,3-dioxygenase-like lactoylglutathione lyase family enzyme